MKVSIIIPVYNVQEYIFDCLDSVSKQTMTEDVECILVDDCGTDESITIVQEYITNYKGNIVFSLIHHEQNGGLSAARNTGLRESNGDYVFLLDSDDTITRDCIKTMYSLAVEHGYVDMVQGCYDSDNIMLRNFHVSMPDFTNDRSYIKKSMLDYDNFPVMAQNRLVKRSLLINKGLYFKEGIIHEDNHWTYFLSKYISSLAICKKATYFYRSNPNGIVGQKNLVNETKAFQTMISDFSANVDEFEKGAQKTFILNHLITLLDNHYYNEKNDEELLIKKFTKTNSWSEILLLQLYLSTRNPKLLHLLIRLYNYRWDKNILPHIITNKLWYELNPRFRKYIINPILRFKMRGTEVTLLCNNCNGACILHDCGLKFNSPCVNVGFDPKDFIKFCSNINHYKNCELTFLAPKDIPQSDIWIGEYPKAKLDDIYLYFPHYKSQEDAAHMWYKRIERMDLNNIHAILVERDGCTVEDMRLFDKLPIKKAIFSQFPHSDIPSIHYISGFETEMQLGLLMDTIKGQYLGRKYYDQFNYTSFLKN